MSAEVMRAASLYAECPTCGMKGVDTRDGFRPVTFGMMGDSVALACRICGRRWLRKITDVFEAEAEAKAEGRS